jgi:hypothetical protein
MTTEQKIEELRRLIRKAAKNDTIENYLRTVVYTDKETGVEYLVLFDGNYFRSICPRYNADGTLRINEEFRK